jgi:CMP-N,N'-diacetyllegionaminic acid synthase
MQNNNILAVIPARGGSKGIPRKNLYKIGGKTLVAHAVEMAKECGFYTVVSSEDKEILTEAFNNGASLIERPQRLADLADKQPTAIDVWRHAWINAERLFDKHFDYSVYLEPTSPLRIKRIVLTVINTLIDTSLDSVWTISPIDKKYHTAKQLQIENVNIKLPIDVSRRQDVGQAYYRNGIAYAVTRQTLLEQSSLTGETCGAYVVYGPSVNVDVLEDLELLEFYWKKVHPNQV